MIERICKGLVFKLCYFEVQRASWIPDLFSVVACDHNNKLELTIFCAHDSHSEYVWRDLFMPTLYMLLQPSLWIKMHISWWMVIMYFHTFQKTFHVHSGAHSVDTVLLHKKAWRCNKLWDFTKTRTRYSLQRAFYRTVHSCTEVKMHKSFITPQKHMVYL